MTSHVRFNGIVIDVVRETQLVIIVKWNYILERVVVNFFDARSNEGQICSVNHSLNGFCDFLIVWEAEE